MHIKKTATLILFAVLFFLIPTRFVQASDTSYGYALEIFDNADLLSDTEELLLEQDMNSLIGYGNVIFASSYDNPYSDSEYYANHFYFDRYGDENGVIFMIDMDRRQIVIYSAGALSKQITGAYADTITDNIYTYASDGDYYRCAKEAYHQMQSVLAGTRINQPMKYISNAFLSVLIAFIINFTILLFTNVSRKASNHALTESTNHHCNFNNPLSIFVRKTKKYSPQSSGSSGGGGGSSGSHSSGSGSSGSHSF